MKSLKSVILESHILDAPEKVVKQLPDMEDILPGDNIVVKIKGHKYTICHREEDDKSWGKYHIFKDREPIELIDYGPGHKFHGYNFSKKSEAYASMKKFMANL